MFAAFQLQLSFAILSCQGGLDLSTHFAEDKEEEAEKEETAEDEDAKESGLLTPHSWDHLTSSTPPRNIPELIKAWKLFSRIRRLPRRLCFLCFPGACRLPAVHTWSNMPPWPRRP